METVSEQRSGEELSDEWSKHSQSGVLGATHHFTQSLSPEARIRLFEYDAQKVSFQIASM